MTLTQAVLVAAGMANAAVSAAADPGTAVGPNVKNDERLVCFAEKKTGSHLRKRICVTPEEMEQRRKADQEAMRNLRQSSRGSGDPLGSASQ